MIEQSSIIFVFISERSELVFLARIFLAFIRPEQISNFPTREGAIKSSRPITNEASVLIARQCQAINHQIWDNQSLLEIFLGSRSPQKLEGRPQPLMQRPHSVSLWFHIGLISNWLSGTLLSRWSGWLGRGGNPGQTSIDGSILLRRCPCAHTPLHRPCLHSLIIAIVMSSGIGGVSRGLILMIVRHCLATYFHGGQWVCVQTCHS